MDSCYKSIFFSKEPEIILIYINLMIMLSSMIKNIQINFFIDITPHMIWNLFWWTLKTDIVTIEGRGTEKNNLEHTIP